MSANATNDELAATSSSSSNSASGDAPLPTCVVVLGMAGSGKTTFVQRLTSHLHERKTPPYLVNLDPAVHEVPYPANIDIRDTVNYKELMKQHKLGPNGAIMTALNLFSTRFDQVVQLIDKRKHEIKYVVLDTPGQIEVFTWSASGTIITETLASMYPTIVVYVMDSARSQSPVTFMSNMVYACSIMYKTKLPFIVALNKCDIVRATNLVDWMHNFDHFEEALRDEQTYISDLSRSMSLVLDEFYEVLESIEISALTGFGFDEFVESVGKARVRFEKEYKPEYERLLKEKENSVVEQQRKQLESFALDHKEDKAMAAMSTGTELLTGHQIHLGNLDDAGNLVTGTEVEENRLDSDDEDDPDEDKADFQRFLAAVRNPNAK